MVRFLRPSIRHLLSIRSTQNLRRTYFNGIVTKSPNCVTLQINHFPLQSTLPGQLLVEYVTNSCAWDPSTTPKHNYWVNDPHIKPFHWNQETRSFISNINTNTDTVSYQHTYFNYFCSFREYYNLLLFNDNNLCFFRSWLQWNNTMVLSRTSISRYHHFVTK